MNTEKFAIFFIGFSVVANIGQAEELMLSGPGSTLPTSAPILLSPSNLTNTSSNNFDDIISKITVESRFLGSEKITEEILSALLNKSLSTSAISAISDRVRQRIANLTLKSGVNFSVTFGAEVAVAMLVDFVAEEVLEYQLQTSGSTVVAAGSYVLIKQAYILSTSKTPLGVVVGQAGLLIDIAIKDIQAFNDYTEARDMAKHSQLRLEMWDAFGTYMAALSVADTERERSAANNAFYISMEDISNSWNLYYNIVPPSSGSFNSQLNRPIGVRDRSKFTKTFEDTLAIFVSLQREMEFISPNAEVKNLGPFRYQIPQKGFVPEYIELNPILESNQEVAFGIAINPNLDRSNERVTEIINDANPGRELRYSGGYAYVLDDGSYNETGGIYQLGEPVSRGDTVEVIRPDNSRAEIQVLTESSGGFEYTSWGTWSSTDFLPNEESQAGYWVAGQVIPFEVIENRTGTATFEGAMFGDFVRTDGSRFDTPGVIRLEADFTNMEIAGEMEFNTGAFQGTFGLESDIQNFGGQAGFGGTFNGGTHGFDGTFFGPNAEEVGGTAWASTPDGVYNGVFRAD